MRLRSLEADRDQGVVVLVPSASAMYGFTAVAASLTIGPYACSKTTRSVGAERGRAVAKAFARVPAGERG